MSEQRAPESGGIEDFVAEVVANPALMTRLLPIEDRREFLDEVLEVARAAGYALTAGDLEVAMNANRRRWIERSLPW